MNDSPQPVNPTDQSHPQRQKAPMYGAALVGVTGVSPIDPTVKLWMAIIISAAVMSAALYIIIRRETWGNRQRWAVGAITTVSAFWFGKFSDF